MNIDDQLKAIEKAMTRKPSQRKRDLSHYTDIEKILSIRSWINARANKPDFINSIYEQYNLKGFITDKQRTALDNKIKFSNIKIN